MRAFRPLLTKGGASKPSMELLEDKWADVKPEIMRQSFFYDKLGPSGMVGMAFQKISRLFQVASDSMREPITSLKKLSLKLEQSTELPLARRKYLQYKVGEGNLSSRTRTSQLAKATKARRVASIYQKSEAELWEEMQRPGNLREYTNLVDEKIRFARASGSFDNLPGRGKPLPEERPLFVDNTEFLLNRIVQRNGGTAAWVDREKEIQDSLTHFRKLIRDGWIRNGTCLNHQWEEKKQAYATELHKINQRIRDYNLSVPSMRLQRPLYRLEYELEKVSTP